MEDVWIRNILVLFISVIVGNINGLIIIEKDGQYEKHVSFTLDASVEYVLTYPQSSATNPHTLKAYSTDASATFPILIVVRQATQVSSWTIPDVVETRQKNKTLYFYNASKTLCHDDMDAIMSSQNPEFSIGPLLLKQRFIVSISTSSPENVSITVALEEEKVFYIVRDKNYTLQVSPSQSRHRFFSFDDEASDTIIIEIDSLDDICFTVSVQDSRCPVRDSNKDIKYEGTYQTVNKKGAITIAKRLYRKGFFLVFVAKPDDYECSQESSAIPIMTRVSEVMENNITSTITFRVKNSITAGQYVTACLVTMTAITLFGLIFTAVIFVFNRFGTISKQILKPVLLKDYIQPYSDDEINKIILGKDLTVNTFAKYPKRIQQRSFNYLSHTFSIALFYSIPVIQLVVTYQRVVNLTGNQDVCYYNFLCAHPLFVFSDFNHIFSNIGYIFIGIFFILGVLDRQHKIKINKDNGIPAHYGLFLAMGLALTIEGLLSAGYHICPTQSNYQFDTSFMYVMTVLIMVKLYQNRHPDINATAYSTFSVIGGAIFMAVLGILEGSLFIWILSLIGYASLIIILSLKIYYLNFVVYGAKQFYSCYQENGLCTETFAPVRRGRFILVLIANITNFGILFVGLYIYLNNVTDFGTFLLGLLLSNTVLHISFYTLMKIIHKEKISTESFIFGFLGLCCWIAAGIFFLDAATLWTVSPAESRTWNQGCIFLGFYDKHDVWHLLSAPALYFTFLYLMYLDDDLCDKPQNQIPVF